MGKEFTCNAGDTGDVGSILGSGRSLGGGHGNPLQYSCLENPMDRGAWGAAKIAKSWTRLEQWHPFLQRLLPPPQHPPPRCQEEVPSSKLVLLLFSG